MPAVLRDSPAGRRASLSLGDDERWYVVRTQPHREIQAARQLENQTYSVFCPRFFKSRRHTRKFETVLAPLFPRYMLVILDLARDRWRSVNGDLKQLLASNPPWRPQFFPHLLHNITGACTPLDIFLTLRTSPTPPSADELSGYLNFLIQHKFYELAYYAWLQLLPPEQLTKAARLFNGGFETAPSGSPFDWVFNGGSGVTIELDGRLEQAKGNALLVELGPGRVDFSGVTELVVLSPGTYHLKGSYKSDVASVRGLQWRIVCAGTANSIGENRPITGSDPTWREFDVAFTVPADNCPAQYVDAGARRPLDFRDIRFRINLVRRLEHYT